MEHQRGEARGAPGAARRPPKPSIGSKTISNAGPDTDGHQFKPQNVHKEGQDGAGRPISASFEGRATSRIARSFDSPKGAAPGPAAPHASTAFVECSEAQPRPLSYAAQPVADYQPHNGVPLINPSTNGQQHNPAVSVPQQPPVASPSDTQREPKAAEAPIGAARPMPATSTETCSRPPNGTLSHQHPMQAATSTDPLRSSLPSLLTSAPAANGRLGSDLGRQHGSPGDVHGLTAGISPVGQLSADGGHAYVSKPILKMKRTGQNFPIASPRSSSPLRMPAVQNKAPSPNEKTGPAQRGSRSLSKASSSPQTRGIGVQEAENGSTVDKKTGSGTPIRPSTTCRTNGLELG